MESKLLSDLVGFKVTSLPPSDPQMVDVPPVEVANLVAMKLLHVKPAVGSTREGK